jgi:hypothetical protein
MGISGRSQDRFASSRYSNERHRAWRTKAEEEEAAQLHARAEQEAKEKSEREAREAAAAPSVPCVVPLLHGRSLAATRKLLVAGNCKLGTVRRPPVHRGPLVVSAQSPGAGKVLARGSAVNVTLAAKPKRGL